MKAKHYLTAFGIFGAINLLPTIIHLLCLLAGIIEVDEWLFIGGQIFCTGIGTFLTASYLIEINKPHN